MMTAPKQDKGPLGHAFVAPLEQPHWDKCAASVRDLFHYEDGKPVRKIGHEWCCQPASAHKAEPLKAGIEAKESSWNAGMHVTVEQFIDGGEDVVAPEPAHKAGASAEQRAREITHLGVYLGCVETHSTPDGSFTAMETHSLQCDTLTALIADRLRAAEAAARREEREEIIKAIETGLRLNLPLFVVAGRVRARGGSHE